MNIKKLVCLVLAFFMLTTPILVACSDDEAPTGPLAPSGPVFETMDFPEVLLGYEEYIELDDAGKSNYKKDFASDIAFVKWYQEAYRLSGKAGSLSSKLGYMDGFDKTGFPSVILTWEEYNFCEDWRLQTAYRKTFYSTDNTKDYEAFVRWFNEAKRIFEEEQSREEIGDDIIIDVEGTNG